MSPVVTAKIDQLCLNVMLGMAIPLYGTLGELAAVNFDVRDATLSAWILVGLRFDNRMALCLRRPTAY